MAESTDRMLIENTLRGDDLAFAELVRRYQSTVWRAVRRRLIDHFESEDAMQEVFLRAFTSLSKFDTSRPFDRWIMRIATNYCIDVLRHRRARQPWLFEEYREISAHCPRQDHAESSSLSSFELGRLACELLKAIKPKNRNAFILRELEGLEYNKVGAALQITPLAARARVFRARQEMHRKLRTITDKGAPRSIPARELQLRCATSS